MSEAWLSSISCVLKLTIIVRCVIFPKRTRSCGPINAMVQSEHIAVFGKRGDLEDRCCNYVKNYVFFKYSYMKGHNNLLKGIVRPL